MSSNDSVDLDREMMARSETLSFSEFILCSTYCFQVDFNHAGEWHFVYSLPNMVFIINLIFRFCFGNRYSIHFLLPFVSLHDHSPLSKCLKALKTWGEIDDNEPCVAFFCLFQTAVIV